jgi:hypothetical protein
LRIIRAKYGGAANIFNSGPQGGSPFWCSLHKIKEYFKLGARFTLGSGTRIKFWTDWWIGDGLLSMCFPRLFQIALEQPDASINQLFRSGRWVIRFRRNLSDEDARLCEALSQELEGVSPSYDQDSVSWALEASSKFSANSLYQRLNQGASVAYAKDIWSLHIPLKIKIFV